MTLTDQQFKKYEEQGAYHWRQAFGGWRRGSPRLRARYEIPIRLLESRLQLSGLRGLDAGCGDGVMVYLLRKRAAAVDGLDASRAALELAHGRLTALEAGNGTLLHGSCYRIPAPDGYYDFVTAVEVIEHLDAPRRFFLEVQRVLKPGGVFICTTPNRLMTKRRDPYHVHEYVAAELRQELQAVFAHASTMGAYPQALDRWYVQGSGIRAIDLAVRGVVKALACLGWNVYARVRPQKASDSLLVGIATRAHAQMAARPALRRDGRVEAPDVVHAPR